MPSVISGERVEFLATGTADAYVDFADLDAGTVTLSADGTSATIALPAPRVGEVRIDPEESHVLDRDRGLVERIGDALGDDPVDDSELYALAEDRLAAAAAESDLRERAETNTRDHADRPCPVARRRRGRGPLRPVGRQRRLTFRRRDAAPLECRGRARVRQRLSAYVFSRPRLMIVFWISLVPSPMSRNGASRMSRSISYSFE